MENWIGTSHPIPQTTPSIQAHVERALHSVDQFVKQEFEEAREVVPELVARETKVMDFLFAENFDVLKAAVRICMYWKGRKVFFGERWLLPMSQTGAGALSMDDIEVLREGGFVALQRPDDGFVYLIDESRISRPPGQSLGETYFRIHYYMAFACFDEPTRRKGSNVLNIVGTKPRPEPVLDREMYDLLRAGLPIPTHSNYIVQMYEEGKEQCLDFLSYKEAKVIEFRSRKLPNRIASNSLAGTLHLLERLGFNRENLPRCLGGNYDYAQFAEWTRMRISTEDIMSSTPLKCNVLSAKPVVRRNSLDGGKAEEEKRKGNALRSRRSFQRRQLELLSLGEQKRVWEMRNEALRKDNAKLEDILASAQECVSESELMLEACMLLADLD